MFGNFLPHIQRLNIGARQLGVDVTRTSVSSIPPDTRDNRSTQRKIVLDEIESLIVLHYPGQAAADKKKKLELLRTHFEASWTEIESVMPLERLRKGYDTLHFSLEGTESKYHQSPAPVMNDGLPEHSAPPNPDSAIPEFLDRRKANGAATKPQEASFVDLVAAE